MNRRRALLTGAWGMVSAFGAVSVAGCNLIPRQVMVPMPTLRPAGPCAGRSSTLVVMLPGAYSRPAEFVDEGFVQALRDQRIDVDVVVADSHLGYFSDRSVLQRLRDDVVAPARAEGYRQVWLVGISLGGYGALAYAQRHGNAPASGVDGVLALAPYLGSRRLLREIADAGGATAWAQAQPAVSAAATPAAEPADADALDRGLWRWLAAPPPGAPPVHLGFGSSDRLADGHRLLAAQLPPGRVLTVPGGHDWPPWRLLWQQWLTHGHLRGDCPAPNRLPR